MEQFSGQYVLLNVNEYHGKVKSINTDHSGTSLRYFKTLMKNRVTEPFLFLVTFLSKKINTEFQ